MVLLWSLPSLRVLLAIVVSAHAFAFAVPVAAVGVFIVCEPLFRFDKWCACFQGVSWQRKHTALG